MLSHSSQNFIIAALSCCPLLQYTNTKFYIIFCENKSIKNKKKNYKSMLTVFLSDLDLRGFLGFFVPPTLGAPAVSTDLLSVLI